MRSDRRFSAPFCGAPSRCRALSLGRRLTAFRVEEADDGGGVGPPVKRSPDALLPHPSEDVGGVESLVEQVDPAVSDVHRTRPDTGGFPVDETRHGPPVPQHVAGIEVAVDERMVVVEDRAVEDQSPVPTLPESSPTSATHLARNAIAPGRPRRAPPAASTSSLAGHHGSIYTSLDFAFAAGNADMTLSFGSTGDAYDNAAMETFWARLKVEIAWIRGSIWFDSRADAHAYLFEFIEVFYNRQRHQGGLGHLPNRVR